MAYYNLEPFGPPVEDLRTANIAMILANVNRKKGARASKVTDWVFHRTWRPVGRTPRQTPIEQMAVLEKFARQQSAVERRKQRKKVIKRSGN